MATEDDKASSSMEMFRLEQQRPQGEDIGASAWSIPGMRPPVRKKTLHPAQAAVSRDDSDSPDYARAQAVHPELIDTSDSDSDDLSESPGNSPRLRDSPLPGGSPCPGMSRLRSEASEVESEEEYLKFLRKNEKRGRSFLCHELHELTKSNSPKSLEFLCRYLKKKGIQLDSAEMLGTKYKETAFHVAVLMENVDCARVLVHAGGPTLVCKPYMSPAYNGVTALHSAITKRNEEIVDLILSSLDAREKADLLKCRGYVLHPVGQYKCPWIPLHLAASVGHMPVFETLVQHGAELWIRDEDNGNTILHTLAQMAVKFPNESVVTFKAIIGNCRSLSGFHTLPVTKGKSNSAVAKNVEEALLRIKNFDGFTPFIYAACLGAVKYAKAITEVENVYKFTEVELVPGSYDLYDMSEIDTAVTNIATKPKDASRRPNCGKLSAIEVFVYAITENNLEFGKLPALQQAMSNKWEAYKFWFFGWLILHVIVMTLFTLSLEFRKFPAKVSEVYNNTTSNANDTTDKRAEVAMHVVDAFILVIAMIYLATEVVDLVTVLRKTFFRAKSFTADWPTLCMRLSVQGEVHRPLIWVFSVSTITLYPLRHYDSPNQDIFYAISSLSGWCFLMFFTRAFKNIGIFTSMLRKMLIHMLAHFSLLLLIFMLGYTTATYALFQESPSGTQPPQVSTILNTFFTLFRVFVSLEEFEITDFARMAWLMKIIFVMFVLHFNILLLNMLIAAMNNAYYRLENKKTLLWLKMRTNALLMIERRLPRCMHPKHNLELYRSSDKWFIRTRNYHVQDIGCKPHNATH